MDNKRPSRSYRKRVRSSEDKKQFEATGNISVNIPANFEHLGPTSPRLVLTTEIDDLNICDDTATLTITAGESSAKVAAGVADGARPADISIMREQLSEPTVQVITSLVDMTSYYSDLTSEIDNTSEINSTNSYPVTASDDLSKSINRFEKRNRAQSSLLGEDLASLSSRSPYCQYSRSELDLDGTTDDSQVEHKRLYITNQGHRHKTGKSEYGEHDNVKRQEKTAYHSENERDIHFVAEEQRHNVCQDIGECASLTQTTLSKLKDSSQKLNSLLKAFYLKAENGKTRDIEPTHLAPPSKQRSDLSESQVKDHRCSIYNKLTKQCTCKNQSESENNLLVQFHEESDYSSSSLGELIKNTKLLKRFMNTDHDNAKTALCFMLQGLVESEQTELLEIVEACIFADICDIFEDVTILEKQMIESLQPYGELLVQEQVTEFLYRLSNSAEGSKYLKMNSKILKDAKKFLKSHDSRYSEKAKNYLIGIIINITESNDDIYASFVEEGMVQETLNYLKNNHKTMHLEGLHYTLKLLTNLSKVEKGQQMFLKEYCNFSVFVKELLEAKSDAFINSCVTCILGNILSCEPNTLCSRCAGSTATVDSTGASASPSTSDKHGITPSRKSSSRVKFGEPISHVNTCLIDDYGLIREPPEELIIMVKSPRFE